MTAGSPRGRRLRSPASMEDELVAGLTTLAVKIVGGGRSLFMLPGADDFVVLDGSLRRTIAGRSQRTLSACPDLPAASIRLAGRTRRTLLLERSSRAGPPAPGDCPHGTCGAAIICVPVQSRGTLFGLLYVEKAGSESEFSPQCLQILELLASQAAISLGHAQHYARVASIAASRTRALEEAGARLLREAEARSQLEAHLLELQKTDTLGRLAAGIAHDFNNYLTIINGLSDLVLSECTHVSPVHERVCEIRAAGERAAVLTRQLLSYLRRQGTDPCPVVLNDVLNDMEPLLRRLVGNDVELRIDRSPAPGAVRAQIAEVRQILVNLATNARDALQDGGSVIISSANLDLHDPRAETDPDVPAGRYVVLTVTDTGCGMPASLLRHVFEPFFTTKGTQRGTGLGLSIVHGIVERMGGSIAVSSEMGRGTTFRIYFPRADDCADAACPSTVRDSVPPEGLRTLLVLEGRGSVEPCRAHAARARKSRAGAVERRRGGCAGRGTP